LCHVTPTAVSALYMRRAEKMMTHVCSLGKLSAFSQIYARHIFSKHIVELKLAMAKTILTGHSGHEKYCRA